MRFIFTFPGPCARMHRVVRFK